MSIPTTMQVKADIESIMIATVAGTPSAEWLKFDMVTAFLNAKLDPNQFPIYMRFPHEVHAAC